MVCLVRRAPRQRDSGLLHSNESRTSKISRSMKINSLPGGMTEDVSMERM